jgi:hypothetical protein
MRLNRNTLIFLGGMLAIIILALVVLNNRTQAPTNNSTASGGTQNVFPDVTSSVITQITVTDNTTSGTLRIIQAPEDGTWIVQDNPNTAQQVTIDTAVSNLVNLQASDVFEADDISQFGLDNPTYTILFGDGGSNNYKLLIGNRNPAGTRFYGLVGDDTKTVYLLSNVSAITTLTSYITNPPVVLITPTPAPILEVPGLLFPDYTANITTVNQLSFSDPKNSQQIILVRGENGAWSLDPFSTNYSTAFIDQAIMQTLVQIPGLFAAVDVLKNVPDLASLGLVEPTYVIEAGREDGTRYTLKVGNLDPSGTRYYVQIFDVPNVGVVDRAAIDSITPFIGNPPFVVEATPEVTGEATSEATAVLSETTPEATAEIAPIETTSESAPETTVEPTATNTKVPPTATNTSTPRVTATSTSTPRVTATSTSTPRP